MSLGTLYIREGSGRKTAPLAIIKALNLDVKVVTNPDEDPEFKKNFPLSKIPAFVGADGFALHELIAISYYLAGLSEDGSKLIGKTLKERADILRWISFANSDLWGSLREIILPLVGRLPYTPETHAAAIAASARFVDYFEAHLENKSYIVGDHATVADYVTVGLLEVAFKTIWDKEFLSKHKGIKNWFDTVINEKPLSEIYETPYKYRDEALKYTPK
ncbi:uncharacterized protein SAPINGB_P006293 [Magnusiomyces paraingens]|uniref:GST C-terminal domain-containing protein n=1 Tax=Magnusiomyces paraingens TaxID=2606893 RepID=A0A5E8CBA6_9ASCO|nr:uncharacterized protein SAPINGB_P006293 [Saprochaete ingens]VVT58606.1 unnamed protein product [Saprochaete ingens]